MDLVLLIAILVGAAMLPFVLFMGIVGLAVLIWSWGRIGRYFVNLGRWMGDWRNFVPLSGCGLLLVILVFVVLPIIGLSRILIVLLMVLLVLVTLFIFFFAAIAWSVQFIGWFWPRWRKLVWSGFVSLWGSLPARSGEGRRRRPKPTAKVPTEKRPPVNRSGLAGFWDLLLGRPPRPVKSAAAPQPAAANVQPPADGAPAKRSWFGTFWALMLGKPQPKRRQSRPASVETTEQTFGPSGSPAAIATTDSRASEPPRSKKARPSRRSWFSAFWALMLGKPSKPGPRESRPEKVNTGDRTVRPPKTTVAAEAKTGAAARGTEATSGEKPARRGSFSGIWNSIVRGVTFVVGLTILAVLWVVQRIRDGIDWIRVRLNLD